MVEGAHDFVLAAHEDHRRVESREFAREITALAWQLLYAPHIKPGFPEDVFDFLFVKLFGDTVIERHRPTAKFGIGIMPVSAFRLGNEGFMAHRDFLLFAGAATLALD
jgi:hypothetical protein